MTDMDRLFRLLEEKGGARYGGEQVNQLEHALQCALLAERSQSSDSLIIAALLHDIGHLTSDDEGLAARGRDARHEDVGAAELGRTFGPEVTEPVRLHVEAKRYLCATNERYRGHLSPASITSLRVQGGVFSEQEAEQFARHAFAKPAIALRSWDDNAKCPDTQTPSLDHFRAIAEPLSRGWRAGRLVLVVGPSGAGKDTLIAAAQERLAGDPRYVFPKRVVTRPCNREREAHESATETQFEERLANGGFCLAWQAHGLSYGLPLSVATVLSFGRTAVVNVSRSVIADACDRFPNVEVVYVDAAPATIVARLGAREGLSEADRSKRLSRAVDWPYQKAKVTEINNDGPLADSLAIFLKALAA